MPVSVFSEPESSIEKTILTLLNQGLAISKENKGLLIEYAENNPLDFNFLENNKDQIYAYLEENKKYCPLSFSQQMMCVQSELYKNTSYQIPIPFFINQTFSKENLIQALKKITERHSILRTLFPKIYHQWIQLITSEIKFDVNFLDFSSETEHQEKIADLLQNENRQRFNLAEPPLFRINCAKISEQKYLLVLTVHHAVFDGLSIPIFIHELMENLNGNPLPQLQAQYFHFVLEQKAIPSSVKQNETAWWQQYLHNAPTHTPLKRSDHNKSDAVTTVLYFKFNKNDRDRFFDYCKKINVSITLFILTGFYLLLHRLTGQEDLIIGTILNQRNRIEYENVIGDFNNLIPLRLQLQNNISYENLIKLVQKNFFDTYSHQKLTFNELLSQAAMTRGRDNLPFYNVFLDSLNFDAFQRSFTKDHVELLSAESLQIQAVPLMDLFLLLVQQNGELMLFCGYKKNVFNPEQARGLLEELNQILLKAASSY